MTVEEILEKRLALLYQCIKGGIQFLLETSAERNFIYNVLYPKQYKNKGKNPINS